MIYEKSCGFVVYRESEGVREYLLVSALNGKYGFPKGHVERGETEYETAVRELKEETNLEVRAIDGFRRQIEYRLPQKRDTMKRCVYFLGEYTEGELIRQEEEILDAVFVPFEQAMAMIPFANAKAVLQEADAYIDSLVGKQ